MSTGCCPPGIILCDDPAVMQAGGSYSVSTGILQCVHGHHVIGITLQLSGSTTSVGPISQKCQDPVICVLASTAGDSDTSSNGKELR